MATKRVTKPKAAAKAPTKKVAKKAPRRAAPKKAASKITRATISFQLTPAEIKQARECLARSGEIRYTFKDVRVTKLPHVLDDGKLID